MLSVIGVAGWIGYRGIARDHEERLSATLQSINGTTRQAVRSWAEHERSEARMWAGFAEVVASAQALLRAGPDRAALLASPGRAALARWLARSSGERRYSGYALLGPGNVVLASSSLAEVGARAWFADSLASAWAGGEALLLPTPGGGEAEPRLFHFVAPVREASGRVIALLALRVDPADEFAPLLERGHVGEPGETFAFDRQGRLLTPGRFEGRLRGAAPPLTGRGALAPRRTAAATDPATARSAAVLAAGPVNSDSGVDLAGYVAYHGAKVVGAWSWDPDLGFGLATEVDRASAYGALASPGRVLAGLCGLSMLLVLGVFASRRRSRQLETLVDGAPLGMLLVDLHGVIRRANPNACRLFGYAAGELAGRPVDHLVPEALRAGHDRHRQDYARAPRTRAMGSGLRLKGCHRDGSSIDVEVALSPVTIGGEPFVLAMAWDIGPRLAMELALAERTEELARSNHDLEQFAYVASHDLRAPLRGIQQLADWLAEDLAPGASAESRQYLELVRSRVRRMDALLNSLLEYARASRGAEHIETIDLGRAVPELAALQNWPASFALRVDDRLPTLRTDAAALQQVFLNLLGNAVKHHDRGEGTVTVSWRNGGVHEFRVSDDGPGIPESLHAKAFEMFQTLRPRDEVEGSGMGLALVKRIVERHGGTIALEANEPRGTTVRFTWPEHHDRRSPS